MCTCLNGKKELNFFILTYPHVKVKVYSASGALKKVYNSTNKLVACFYNIDEIYIMLTNKNIFNFSSEILANLGANFSKCVQGYHLVNNDPIKETPWEDINAIILNKSGCCVNSKSNGSHSPGADLHCSFGSLSNKSAKYEPGNTMFKISSYRLTTVCSDKSPGDIGAIIAEINKRKNFNFYSIIVRDRYMYEWYLIPSDFYVFDPSSYTWTCKIGKFGKNKGNVTGWETNTQHGSSMSISFSMSSQLWIDVHVTDEIKKFMVGKCPIPINGRKYDYIELYDKAIVN
jgi:hypothetical protein